MKLAYFTDPISDPIVHLNILLLLGVIERLLQHELMIIMMTRTCTKSHHLRADEDDDDELDKVRNHYL